ncbi:hypothetical protein JG688_00016283, partial [Phytophthora aleatoria]
LFSLLGAIHTAKRNRLDALKALDFHIIAKHARQRELKKEASDPRKKLLISPKERQISVHHHSAAQCMRMKTAMMRIRKIMSMELRHYPCGVNNEIDAGYLANGRNATTDEISVWGDASGGGSTMRPTMNSKKFQRQSSSPSLPIMFETFHKKTWLFRDFVAKRQHCKSYLGEGIINKQGTPPVTMLSQLA